MEVIFNGTSKPLFFGYLVFKKVVTLCKHCIVFFRFAGSINQGRN